MANPVGTFAGALGAIYLGIPLAAGSPMAGPDILSRIQDLGGWAVVAWFLWWFLKEFRVRVIEIQKSVEAMGKAIEALVETQKTLVDSQKTLVEDHRELLQAIRKGDDS